MLEVAWRHQDEGRRVFIVTAASQELADTMALVFQFDAGIGMRSEIRDGYYTGRPDGPFTYREGKAEAIRQVAAEEGLCLTEGGASADPEPALPMLRTVGHPVAVNPDAELMRVAREEGWEIMRFDRLGRRLRLAGGAAAIGLLGVSGGYLGPRIWGRART